MTVGRRAAPVDIDPRAVAPEQVALEPAEPAALESEPEDAPEREAPTGAVTMVPVTMEAGALSPLHGPGHGPGSNGSASAVAEPEAPSERVARPIELPRERRPRASTLGALAAVAGVAAVVLGTLAFLSALERDASADDPAARDARRAIGLLSKPSTDRIPFAGSGGGLVLAVGSGGRGVLLLRGLEPAPSGRTYEVWVVGPAGGAPDPDVLFSGNEKVVELARPVPEGSSVGVTVEDAVGADTPTQPLRLVASRGE